MLKIIILISALFFLTACTKITEPSVQKIKVNTGVIVTSSGKIDSNTGNEIVSTGIVIIGSGGEEITSTGESEDMSLLELDKMLDELSESGNLEQ